MVNNNDTNGRVDVKLRIEFFHDVICSFCFPMSYRMRLLSKMMPDLQIVHRSFALAPDDNAMELMFGSRENAKQEILQHWKHANENDDLHRFNIAGMKNQDFLFPTSINALRAAKAAELIGDETLYWDVFDALQDALFVKSRNIEDIDVIFDVVKNIVSNFDEWQKQFEEEATLQAVLSDLSLARTYDIQSVPSLIVDGKYIINGAQPLDSLKQSLEQLLEKKRKESIMKPIAFSVKQDMESGGNSCKMVDGKWQCD